MKIYISEFKMRGFTVVRTGQMNLPVYGGQQCWKTMKWVGGTNEKWGMINFYSELHDQKMSGRREHITVGIQVLEDDVD